MAKFRQFLADVLQNDNERTTGIRIYHPLGAQNFEEATKMQECIIKIFGQIWMNLSLNMFFFRLISALNEVRKVCKKLKIAVKEKKE